MQEVAFWSVDDQEETLIHTTPEDAAEAYLDDVREREGALPKSVRVFAWKRVKVDIDPHRILEYVLELLDEEYGDPSGDSTEPTQAMQDAATEFARIIEREYEPWACEQAPEFDQDVRVPNI